MISVLDFLADLLRLEPQVSGRGASLESNEHAGAYNPEQMPNVDCIVAWNCACVAVRLTATSRRTSVSEQAMCQIRWFLGLAN